MVALSRSIEIELLLKNAATAGLRAAGNDVTRFSRTAESETKKLDLGFKVLNKTTSVLIGAISGLAVGSLFQLLGAFSESEEKVDNLSEKILNLAESTKFLSFELTRIAEAGKGGFSDERTASIVTILTKSIDQAQKGTKLFSKAFEDMEVPVKTGTGQLRQLEDVLRDLDDILLTTSKKRGGFAAIFGNESEISRARQVIREIVTNLGENNNAPDTQRVLAESRIRRFNEMLDLANKETDAIKKSEKEKEKAVDDARKRSESDAKKSADVIANINRQLAEDIEEANIRLIKDPVEKINAEYDKLIRKVRELSTAQSSLGGGINPSSVQGSIDALNKLRQQDISEAITNAGDEAAKTGDDFKALGEAGEDVAASMDKIEAALGTFLQSASLSFFDVVIAKTTTWKALLMSLSRDLFGLASSKFFSALLASEGGQNFIAGIGSIFLAKGGVVPGGLKPFQSGGVVQSPTLALMGEGKNSEAVVPLPDNRSIPVKFTGGGADRAMNINISIPSMDGPSVRDFLTRNRREVIQMIRAAVRSDYGTRSGIMALG